jgi:hypothetical protein
MSCRNPVFAPSASPHRGGRRETRYHCLQSPERYLRRRSGSSKNCPRLKLLRAKEQLLNRERRELYHADRRRGFQATALLAGAFKYMITP